MIQTILIVDDSPVARMILKKCLPSGHGFTLFEAGDGRQAVDAYVRENPDMVFLDLTMPVMDGFQALEAIRGLNPNAIVVVATADVQVKTINRVMDAGALLVLKKPVSRESIAGALSQAAEKAGLL